MSIYVRMVNLAPILRKIINEQLDHLLGGKSDKMSLKDITKKHNVSLESMEKQLAIGIKVELEHTKDKELAKEIATDHLFEIPDYYTRLLKMEKHAEKK